MELNVNDKKFMIMELNKNVTRDDRPYLRFVLSDVANKLTKAIMFDSNKLHFEPDKGNIVAIAGIIQNYNGQFQLKINKMDKLDDINYYDFLPKSVFDKESMFNELVSLLHKNISDQYMEKLVALFLEDSKAVDLFKVSPAAKSIHHAYVSGLLEHTLSVVRLAIDICKYYKELINKDILVVGSLFHDIGKIFELDISKGFDYTDSGKLLGHLILGIDLVNGYMHKIPNFPIELKNLIGHMIASHHGLLEYGSPEIPKTNEALILHYIDDMDSKINNFKTVFERDGVSKGWSSYDRILERQLFKHISAKEMS